MVKGKVGFRFDILLLVMAVVGMGAGGGGLYYNDALARRHAAWITVTQQIQAGALSVKRAAEDVGRGVTPDFAELAGKSQTFGQTVRGLREGSADTEPMPGTVLDQIDAIEKAWAPMQRSLAEFEGAKPAVTAATEALRRLDPDSAELLAAYRQIADRLASGGGPERAVSAGEQMARAERLRVLARRLLGDGHGAGEIAQRLAAEADTLVATHARLEGDGPVGSLARDNTPRVEQVAASVRELAAAGPALDRMQKAAAVLPDAGRDLHAAAVALEDALGPPAGSGRFLRVAILPALGVAIVALVLYVVLNIVSVRQRVRRAEERDRQQQSAILSLLDEIGTLADGDLTVRASVTEDFTGAIADSINYTIDTLRSLVGTINETAVEISAAATSTRETAGVMQSASERQAQDVGEIAGSVKQSAESLNAVATRAEQLSQQAGTSVEVAHNGASTVGRTIQGMAALREQIQDTAKRIKRLGESSQEIGNIVEFINDIAEQTNTLALNASIQAAMAGESGRGFAVVADQVQQLAERVAAATRQIETLVKTIQADTNEAIVSMERSTSNVIAGARSAEEAGQALTRIEATSNDLARLIQDISGEARSEAAQATRIAGQVQSIRDVAFQTAASAQKTAEAVSELNALSSKLRESVAGFRLPPDVSLETGAMPMPGSRTEAG